MKQAVQVNIQGQEFSLKTDLSPAQVEEVAGFVNEQIGRIAGADRSVDTYRAVVLALLNVTGLYLHGTAPQQAEANRTQSCEDGDWSERLASLAERLEEALKDPQGTLDF